MADENKNGMDGLLERIDLLEQTVATEQAKTALLQSKLEAIEELAASGVLTSSEGDAVTNTKRGKLAPSGETFKVGKDEYQMKYPRAYVDGKYVDEKDVVSDKARREELVKSNPGLFRKLGMVVVILFAFVMGASATSVTITPTTAEVITTTTRSLYRLQDLLIIYRASTDAFEVQEAETRSKVWGGDVDSVTISGVSTTANKLAYLRTLMLETTTTGGYRCFIGRNDIQFFYNTSTNRLDLKKGRNKQPLWFGAADSLQSGPSGAAAKIAYLRLVNRWRAQDVLPTTSVATIAAGAAAGSSPTVSVTGDAFSGTISVTTGTTATTGTLATVTLKATAPTGWHCVVKATSTTGIVQEPRVKASATTTTLVLTVPTTALSDATAYTFEYVCVPY